MVTIMSNSQDRATIIGLLPKWAGWSLTTPHIGFLHSVLRFLGEKITPSFLMAVSGEAFRSFISVPPKKICGTIEAENFMTTALAALGYEYEIIEGHSPDEVIPKAAQYIEKGMPVPAWHIGSVPEWGLIVGIHKSRETLITQDIITPQGELGEQKAHELIWKDKSFVMIGIKPKTSTPDLKAVAHEAIVRAVEMSNRDEVNAYDYTEHAEAGPFITGVNAYGALIGWLEDASDEELAAHAEWDFPYLPLVLSSCRKAANVFLKEYCNRFQSENSQILRSAARNFGRTSDAFIGLKKIFPFPGIADDLLNSAHKVKAVELLTHAASCERRAFNDLRAFLRQRI